MRVSLSAKNLILKDTVQERTSKTVLWLICLQWIQWTNRCSSSSFRTKIYCDVCRVSHVCLLSVHSTFVCFASSRRWFFLFRDVCLSSSLLWLTFFRSGRRSRALPSVRTMLRTWFHVVLGKSWLDSLTSFSDEVQDLQADSRDVRVFSALVMSVGQYLHLTNKGMSDTSETN